MQPAQPRQITLKDVLFMPVGCLLTLSPGVILVLFALVALVGSYFYHFVNVDFFGMGAPPFKELTISPDFKRIDRPDGSYLTLSFEQPFDSTFSGVVRHISPIRLGDYPILTHDVLVTSGDFADPDRVHTSVSNHHFSWISEAQNPQGTIHLLHTVPATEAIYQQLLELQSGQTVKVIGREILKIEAYAPDSTSKGWWQDSGCNTLVVTAIEFLPSP